MLPGDKDARPRPRQGALSARLLFVRTPAGADKLKSIAGLIDRQELQACSAPSGERAGCVPRHLRRRFCGSRGSGAPTSGPGTIHKLDDDCTGLWAHAPVLRPIPTGACIRRASQLNNLVHFGDASSPAAW